MDALPMPTPERLADRSAGIEQQLIELVARREAVAATGQPERDLDGAISELHDELADVAERLVAVAR